MQKRLVIVTNDGKIHRSEKAARKHLEARYADLLNPLAHRLLPLNYSALTEALHESIEVFRQMVEIQEELKRGVVGQDEEQ